MKKILHIQVLSKLSGVQRISLEVLKRLPETEYEKWILFSDELSANEREICKKEFENIGVKVLFSNKMHRKIRMKDFSAIREIYQLCRREKFDIVHTHSTKPGIVGRIAATFARVPLVVHTVHGLAFHKFVKFPRWQFYWACEMIASLFCHKIVMVNKYYGKYFKWFKRKLSTIYNGVDFSQFPQILDSSQNEEDAVKVLFVGRLDTPKDPITLLKAAKIVIDKNPSVQFTFVGDGEYYEQCAECIRKWGLSQNISLEGWQTNVSNYYTSHQIFAASSIYEAFGLMFLEAGYFHLPVVATNVEGIPEVVINGKTGFLVPPKEPEMLAEKIEKFIHDKDLRLSFGNNAHQWILDNFSASKMVDKYQNIYEIN